MKPSFVVVSWQSYWSDHPKDLQLEQEAFVLKFKILSWLAILEPGSVTVQVIIDHCFLIKTPAVLGERSLILVHILHASSSINSNIE